MDEHTRQQAFLTALVTEHFVQGSARAATITESNGRAAIYLSVARRRRTATPARPPVPSPLPRDFDSPRPATMICAACWRPRSWWRTAWRTAKIRK